MINLAKKMVTVTEYLALERNANEKHEFYKGEMFAMAGAKKRHNQIVFNITGQLYNQLKEKPCIAFGSDMKVRVKPDGLFTYPDIQEQTCFNWFTAVISSCDSNFLLH